MTAGYGAAVDELDRTASQVRYPGGKAIHRLMFQAFVTDNGRPVGYQYAALCGDVLITGLGAVLTTRPPNCRGCGQPAPTSDVEPDEELAGAR